MLPARPRRRPRAGEGQLDALRLRPGPRSERARPRPRTHHRDLQYVLGRAPCHAVFLSPRTTSTTRQRVRPSCQPRRPWSRCNSGTRRFKARGRGRTGLPCRWRELTAAEEGATVAGLRELVGGRADLLAEVARLPGSSPPPAPGGPTARALPRSRRPSASAVPRSTGTSEATASRTRPRRKPGSKRERDKSGEAGRLDSGTAEGAFWSGLVHHRGTLGRYRLDELRALELAGGLVVVPPVLGEDADLAPGGGHARPGIGSARISAVNTGRISSSCRNAHSAGPRSGRGGNDRGAART